MKPGERVILVVPDNPRLDGVVAVIHETTEWGAHVLVESMVSGRYRAAFEEMIRLEVGLEVGLEAGLEAGLEVKGASAMDMGFTGNSCTICGSVRVVRNGTCELCLECGTTSGCS